MVPELASVAAAELADLREAVFAAAAVLPAALGRGRRRTRRSGRRPGRAARSRATASTSAWRCPPARAPGELPLCALVTGLGTRPGQPTGARRGAGVRRRPRVEAAMTPAGGCAPSSTTPSRGSAGGRGRRPHPHPSAPGGYDPDSVTVQAALDDALAAVTPQRWWRLPSGRWWDGSPTRCWPGCGHGTAVGAGAVPRGALRRGIFRGRLDP